MKNKIEMPTIVQRIGLRVHVYLTYLMAFMAIIGLLMRDAEMATVSSVITVIFATLVFFTRRKFKKYYEEIHDRFFVNAHIAAYRVYYDNLIDWKPLSKKICVLDGKRTDNRYICIHFAFAKPEILLRKLTEMTFAGKFKQADPDQSDDPNREQEWMNHLRKNGYGYIIEEYLKEQPSSEQF